MEGARLTLFIICLLFIIFSPDQPVLQRYNRVQHDNVVDQYELAKNVLANSTYNELSQSALNLTGFRAQDGFQWDLLSVAKKLSEVQRQRLWTSPDDVVYRRVSGELRGDFDRVQVSKQIDHSHPINLTSLDPGSEYVSPTFLRNVTEKGGHIILTLEDSDGSDQVKEIRSSMSIQTESAPGQGWQATLQGIHFSTGTIVLSTSSTKFNSLPALPQFMLSRDDFDSSRRPVIASLAKQWNDVQDIDTPMFAAPKCELIVWLQSMPFQGSLKYVKQLESELLRPGGGPIPPPPLLGFSAVVFSPDCGYILQADSLLGVKVEVYWTLVRRLVTAFIIIVGLQIVLLKRQMEKCATPSTKSRIAYHSVGIAAFGDGLTFFAMVGLLMIDSHAFLLTAAAAFLCCIQVAVLEVKLVFDIWTVQVGDPAQAQRDRQRRAAAAATTQPRVVQGPEGLPLPVTAPTEGATPITLPAVDATQPDRISFGPIYSRFYFALLNLTFFSMWAMSWPRGLRSAYMNLLIFCYFSLWTPQIYRNVMRNCRKALEWEYVIGNSVLRAAPMLYWYLTKSNVLFAEPSPSVAIFLLGWLWLQVLVLAVQHFLGPRIFVRENWCPPAYEYHPILYADLESGGLPIGEVASASEGHDRGGKRKAFDCAICMNEIDVPVESKDENTGRGWLEQRHYMVTPCRHIFHTECLEGWMNLRLVCPVCREDLPPL